MKHTTKILMVMLITFLPLSIFSQTNYSKAIEDIVSELKTQIEKNNAKKIVFVGIQNNDGSISELGQLITDEILLDCAIELPDINFMDRNDIDQFDQLEEIKSQKLISRRTVNAIANKTKADIVVTGVMTPFGEYYRLITKMYGSSEHNLIGGTKSTIIIEKHLKDLFETNKNTSSTIENKYEDTSTNEKSDDKNPINSNATGDLCFKNNDYFSKQVVITNISTGKKEHIVLSKKTNSCFYNLTVGVYSYEVHQYDSVTNKRVNFHEKSNIKIKAGQTVEKILDW